MQPTGNDSQSPSPAVREARFARLYADHSPDVLAYALRRAERPEDAAEVLAETFLVAWRRFGDVPAAEEARLWLYGVARRTLANHRRGELRRAQLSRRLQAELSAAGPARAVPELERAAMVGALKHLDRIDQEVLLLAGWEELEPAQIARVLGISAVAARGRLHRARRRLCRELGRGGGVPNATRFNELKTEEAR
jgi:RNA polymerase sigma factor (sigma-70 family)